MAANMSDQIRFAIDHAKVIARFGSQMSKLSKQRRREGNHAAAEAAATMAQQAHEVIEAAIMTLPEQDQHQDEIQGIVVTATSLQMEMADLGNQEGTAIQQCSQQEVDWYTYAMHVGQALVMARHSAERATGLDAHLWPSHGNAESRAYVAAALEMAQETLNDMEKQPMPDNTPFPQTRQQVQNQATADRNEIAAILERLTA